MHGMQLRTFAMTELSLATMIGYAFLGGVILNLMPCVFPMLGIKVLSVVKKAGATKRTIRLSGIAYTLGVVASFVSFAIIIAIFKSTGKQVGWGFQLQSPAFIAGLATLFVLMSLNFFGFFEFGLPSWMIPQRKHKQDEGLFGEFMAGVMVALVASPCTAPFMASALGFALTQPTAVMLLVFTFLGLGLGAPFLILTFFPGLTKYLPRPGNWMITFRQLLAFPLLITCVWLIWVFNKQTSPDQTAMLLCFLIAVTFLIWVYKIAKTRPALMQALLVMVSIFPVMYSGAKAFSKPQAAKTASLASGASNSALDKIELLEKHHVTWYKFAPGVVDALVENGKTVFVDFTAAWCITCQANAKTVFGSKKVVNYVNSNQDLALVYADWTNDDPAITAALEEQGRSGIPLYLIYTKGSEKPKILPQLLTPEIFLEGIGANQAH